MSLLDRIRAPKLIGFKVDAGDLRLTIRAPEDLSDAARISGLRHWEHLESYFVRHSAFRTSLVPLPVAADAPELIRSMGEAAEAAGVGPMATISGALCEAVGLDLAELSKEVIVSCEGDTFVVGGRPRIFTVDPSQDSGGSGGTGIALRVGRREPYAFYSSAGRIRIQPVLGRARAVAVIADHGSVADAVGAAMGASILRPHHVGRALDVARRTPGVQGAVVLVEGRVGVWGTIEIITPSNATK